MRLRLRKEVLRHVDNTRPRMDDARSEVALLAGGTKDRCQLAECIVEHNRYPLVPLLVADSRPPTRTTSSMGEVTGLSRH
jgi:hypothetical protein